MSAIGEATRTSKKTVGFQYLQSIALFNAQIDLKKHLGTTDPSQVTAAQDYATEGLDGTGPSIFRVGAASDSGWQMDGNGFITKYNRARYALGLRELYVGNSTYGTAGSIVSKPYEFPGEIDRLELLADEFIPEGFDRDTIWVKYSIIANAVEIPIAPTNQVYGAGEGIPRTLYFNREPSQDDNFGKKVDVQGPVNSVRIKFFMTRPSDAIGSSPVVRGFRFKVVLK